MRNDWSVATSQSDSLTTRVLKLIAQGIPLSLFSFILSFLILYSNLPTLLPSLGGLVFIGAFIIIYLATLGFINTILAAHLWGIGPKRTIGSFLGQGILFGVLMFFFSPAYILLLLPLLLPVSIYLTSGMAFLVVSFVFLSLIGGHVGKNIAAEFEPEEAKREILASVHERLVSCSTCNARFRASPEQADEAGGILCPGCGKWILVYDRKSPFD